MNASRRIPPHLYQYLVIEARGFCSLCRERAIDEIHHIKPVAEGGRSTYDNLVPLCASCHRKLHRSRVTSAQLKRAKAEWSAKCVDHLTAVLCSPVSAPARDRKFLDAFDRVDEVEELSEFRRCLKTQLRSHDLFGNFFSVHHHEIRHEVGPGGDAIVQERQVFAPFSTMQRKRCHITSTKAASADEVQFSARGWIGDREVPISWHTKVDRPTVKDYEILFSHPIAARQRAVVAFSYRWPRGWIFPDDRYAYDVLAWAETVDFQIRFPVGVKPTTVETKFLDIFGRQWPGLGTCRRRAHGYRWLGHRLPLFSRVILAHRTAPT